MTQESYPLSPIQEGMLVQSLNRPGSGVDVWQLVFALPEAVDAPLLRDCLDWMVQRHPALRTAFDWHGAEARQWVAPAVQVPFTAQDWSELPTEEQEIRLEGYLREDRRRGFVLGRPPLIRAALFHGGASGSRILITVHHAVVDGRSVPIATTDLFGRYAAIAAGSAFEPRQSLPFRDYVEHVAAQDASRDEAFWRAAFAGFESPTPAADGLESSAADPSRGHREMDLLLSPETGAALAARCQREGLSLNTVTQAAWGLLLARYSGRHDVAFGAVKSCRASLPGGDTIVGPMVNTLAVRAIAEPSKPLSVYLEELRSFWTALRPHEHTALSKVQEWSDIASGQPLFDSLVQFERYPLSASLPWLGPRYRSMTVQIRRQPGYPLLVHAYEKPGLRLKMIYDTGRFSDCAVRQRLEHLGRLLDAMARQPDARLGDLEPLSPAQRWQSVGEWSGVAVAAPAARTVPEVIAAAARRHPGREAVRWEGESLTYGDLDERSSRLAGHLRRLGLAAEDRVGIFLERTPRLVVAMLAVLKAGGACVPVDLGESTERPLEALDASGARWLVSEAPLHEQLPTLSGCRVVRADREPFEPAAPPPPPRGEQLAWVLYTSGPSGRRGIEIPHRALATWLAAAQELFDDEDLGGCLASTPVSLDVSIFELFAPLARGGRVLLAGDVLRPSRLAAAADVRLVTATPSAMAELLRLEALPPALRTVSFAYDRPSEALLGKLFASSTLERVCIVYGRTEATAFSRVETRRRDGTATVRPLAGRQVYLLDDALKPVPVGATGELLLGGEGLARAVMGDARETAASFAPDPFGSRPGGRLHRTGDLARYRHDGILEPLGRRDRQVLVKGHRVDPGEVEAVLRSHPQVDDVEVAVREDDPGHKRLVAYVVCADAVSPAQLTGFLRQRLPPFLCPEAVLPVGLLPRTAGGALDLRALPRPESRRSDVSGEYVAPRNRLERTIAEVWKDVLRVDKLGVDDNFFDHGGHSLALVQAHEKLAKKLGRDDLLQVDLFTYPTIGSLARYLAEAETEAEAEQAELDGMQERATAQRQARQRRRPVVLSEDVR
jgi:amino acid adenylation domain-containing protein